MSTEHPAARGTCRTCREHIAFDYEDENWLHIATGSQFCCVRGHIYATGGDGSLIVGTCVRCGYTDLLVDMSASLGSAEAVSDD